MSRRIGAVLLLLFTLAFAGPAAAQVQPAQFHGEGSVSGGHADQAATIEQIRFGAHENFHRTVLDYTAGAAGEEHGYINRHPSYVVEYRRFPARINVYFDNVYVEDSTEVMREDDLPVNIITGSDNGVFKLTIYPPGPSEFRVIEVDDPSRLSIDVRPASQTQDLGTVYGLQIFGFDSMDRALELLNSGSLAGEFDLFMDGGRPLLEATYSNLSEASSQAVEIENSHPDVEVIVNERPGDSLPEI